MVKKADEATHYYYYYYNLVCACVCVAVCVVSVLCMLHSLLLMSKLIEDMVLQIL